VVRMQQINGRARKNTDGFVFLGRPSSADRASVCAEFQTTDVSSLCAFARANIAGDPNPILPDRVADDPKIGTCPKPIAAAVRAPGKTKVILKAKRCDN